VKVYIGKYLNWWGPYQLADLLRFVGVSKDRCHAIGKKLADTKLADLCEWIHSKRKRKIKVRIDYYDTWSADHTLAHIIHPLMVQLKNTSHSYGLVSPEDAPEELRGIGAELDFGYDDKAKVRWDWMLDEIIWAFEQSIQEKDGYDLILMDKSLTDEQKLEKSKAYHERLRRAFTLFGKYYQSFWD
jgi:hypothetical protein